MSKQINYYLMQADIDNLEVKLKEIEPYFVLHRYSDTKQPRQLPAINFKENLSYYIVRQVDFKLVQTEYVPNQNYWVIDGTRSPVIELGGCFYDGTILRRDRVYFESKYYDLDYVELIQKSPEFINWADRVFKVIKKNLLKKDSNYIGANAKAWLESSTGKLVDF
jgi:hypothetical protein